MMINATTKCYLLLLLWSSITTQSIGQQGFIDPASDSLVQEILLMDSLLFDAAFNSCDADRLATYVAEDLEFYHDKWGQIADNGVAFVEAVRGSCARQADGTENQAKRALEKATVEIYPLNNFGAIQIGTHRFYQILGHNPSLHFFQYLQIKQGILLQKNNSMN